MGSFWDPSPGLHPQLGAALDPVDPSPAAVRPLTHPAGGFTTGLEPVVTDRTFATLPADKQIQLVQDYWQAVEKVWPDALNKDSTSVLNKTFGVHITCGIAIDVFLYSEQLGDSSMDGMATLLQSTKDLVGDWSTTGPLRTYIGGGRRNVRFVIDALRTRIRNRFEELRQKVPAQSA